MIRLAVNAKVAAVLGLIPASSDTAELEGGGADEAVLYNVYKKKKSIKNPPFKVGSLFQCKYGF